MARRWLPIGLALVAALLDAWGLHGAAFYLLLLAVPATAVAALGALGELLDVRAVGRAGAALFMQPMLWALALTLLVGSAALRAAAEPGLSAAVLSVCLAFFCLEALVAVFAETPREAASRPRFSPGR
jgi:hypothetical protein